MLIFAESMSMVFDGCYKRVRHATSKEDWLTPMASLTRLAHECAETGLPEEEATFHLLWHYYKMNPMVVRSTVRAVYEGYDPLPPLNPGMPKKQADGGRSRNGYLPAEGENRQRVYRLKLTKN